MKDRDGAFRHLPDGLDLAPLAEEFKIAVLGALRRQDAISEELAGRISSLDHHGGFSADGSVLIPSGESVEGGVVKHLQQKT